MKRDVCHIHMIGPLLITDPEGIDITPAGAKTRGLVASLAESPGIRRSRRWIESMLWSDKSAAQAGGSLRQELIKLKRTLGESSDILMSNRLDIWLSPERVICDLDSKRPIESQSREVLEGLDVGDPEFEDWLRVLRQRFPIETPDVSASPAPTIVNGGGLRIRCSASDAPDTRTRILVDILTNQVGQNIEDEVSAWRTKDGGTCCDIDIQAEVCEEPLGQLVSLRVSHSATERVLFSGLRSVSRQAGYEDANGILNAFAHDASSRTLARLAHVSSLNRSEIVASGFAEIARNRLLSYEPEKLASAEELFVRAFEADENGLYLAWRAFLLTTKVIEGLEAATPELLDEADTLLRQAQEHSPENAKVYSLVALVKLLLFDDIDAGVANAESALRRNPLSLFARQSLAVSAGAAQRMQVAYEMSNYCRRGADFEDGRHLWDLYHGLVCIITGRLEEARHALETAVRYCPTFKAPHRQLIALNAQLGDAAGARESLEKLRALEPGFTLDRFVRDPEYPASTLRNSGLLKHGLIPDLA